MGTITVCDYVFKDETVKVHVSTKSSIFVTSLIFVSLSLSVFTLYIESICLKIWSKPLPKNVKSLLAVDLRRSNTSLHT